MNEWAGMGQMIESERVSDEQSRPVNSSAEGGDELSQDEKESRTKETGMSHVGVTLVRTTVQPQQDVRVTLGNLSVLSPAYIALVRTNL
jgi:hypothetical protein